MRLSLYVDSADGEVDKVDSWVATRGHNGMMPLIEWGCREKQQGMQKHVNESKCSKRCPKDNNIHHGIQQVEVSVWPIPSSRSWRSELAWPPDDAACFLRVRRRHQAEGLMKWILGSRGMEWERSCSLLIRQWTRSRPFLTCLRSKVCGHHCRIPVGSASPCWYQQLLLLGSILSPTSTSKYVSHSLLCFRFVCRGVCPDDGRQAFGFCTFVSSTPFSFHCPGEQYGAP